jgi:hypothetical protein
MYDVEAFKSRHARFHYIDLRELVSEKKTWTRCSRLNRQTEEKQKRIIIYNVCIVYYNITYIDENSIT